MPQTRYFFEGSHEQFPPSDLLQQAVEAERAGFDAVGCSDHFQPWWPGGESGHAWVWLGAAAQATERVPVGTGVTTLVHRFHPAIVAQAFMTLEEMFPGRVFLGIGSGESLNETPLGHPWPPVKEQLEMMAEGLEIITRLWDGERFSYRGRHFGLDDAVLHTHPGRRPPVYVSAFGPQAARIAGRFGDGLWTLGDPDSAPEIIDAYRAAAEEAGREPGEIVLHTGMSWAETEEEALEGARMWKGTQIPDYFRDDWHVPEEMDRRAQEEVSDEAFREGFIITADVDAHIERIREIEELGADIVSLQCIGPDPHGTIRTYGESVLPALRGAAVS
ncbi:MAG: TIGR03557 family F420-dependent LLM class oxidoreductase [Actinomycetota bacterium]|nr:TIGR03557 family F420-dependent LLM class oxidoreductase [Actinomycetota bacterium]